MGSRYYKVNSCAVPSGEGWGRSRSPPPSPKEIRQSDYNALICVISAPLPPPPPRNTINYISGVPLLKKILGTALNILNSIRAY